MQFGGRAGEIPVPRGGLEDAQRGERGQAIGHVM